MPIQYSNFCRFMNIKNSSKCQIEWVKEYFIYHFSINYDQEKENK